MRDPQINTTHQTYLTLDLGALGEHNVLVDWDDNHGYAQPTVIGLAIEVNTHRQRGKVNYEYVDLDKLLEGYWGYVIADRIQEILREEIL